MTESGPGGEWGLGRVFFFFVIVCVCVCVCVCVFVFVCVYVCFIYFFRGGGEATFPPTHH